MTPDHVRSAWRAAQDEAGPAERAGRERLVFLSVLTSIAGGTAYPDPVSLARTALRCVAGQGDAARSE